MIKCDDILRAMGFRPSKEKLKDEIDEDGELAGFWQLCTKFLVEDPDRHQHRETIF